MISSMTGFAQRTSKSEFGEFTWDLRSVNHRSIDVAVRIPEHVRSIEPDVRRMIVKRIERGRIDATLKLNQLEKEYAEGELDLDAIEALAHLSMEASSVMQEVEPLNMAQVLSWPNVLVCKDIDNQYLETILEELDFALDELEKSRQSEGDEIKRLLMGNIENLRRFMNQAEKLIPEAEQEYRSRLNDRLSEIELDLDPGRLEQEVAINLLKLDVKEEIERFGLHLAECERVLAEESLAGKRLNFIAQEMFREVSTLSSKSSHYPLNALMVDMKVAIEQIREQTQNLQ